jgi:hypothetical protein
MYRHKTKRLHLGQSLSIEGLRLTTASTGVVRETPVQIRCYNGDELLRASTFDTNFLAVHQSEQGVVFADAYAFAGAHWGAALTNDDAASIDSLAAVNFNAQAF